MKHLIAAADEVEAELLKMELNAEGIETVVEGGILGSGRGELPTSPEAAPQLLVKEEDLDLFLGFCAERLWAVYVDNKT